MKLIKKQFSQKQSLLNNLIIFLVLLTFNGNFSLFAEESYQLKEFEINNTTKSDDDSSLALPSNPFEIVEMLRRANSMNDATKPSDAIDDALKSFDNIEKNKNL